MTLCRGQRGLARAKIRDGIQTEYLQKADADSPSYITLAKEDLLTSPFLHLIKLISGITNKNLRKAEVCYFM